MKTVRSFRCFSCGKPMQMLDILSGWCSRCQVMEEHQAEPYICRARKVTQGTWADQDIDFLDHSSGHYPSPA